MSDDYKYEKLNETKLLNYKWLVGGIKNRLPELNEEQIIKVLEIVLDVCSSCYDGYSSCQCWNDEQMSKLCKNCKHWELEEEWEGFGFCELLELDDDLPKRKDVIFVKPSEWFVEGYVGKDFGCIHFEVIEDE